MRGEARPPDKKTDNPLKILRIRGHTRTETTHTHTHTQIYIYTQSPRWGIPSRCLASISWVEELGREGEPVWVRVCEQEGPEGPEKTRERELPQRATSADMRLFIMVMYGVTAKRSGYSIFMKGRPGSRAPHRHFHMSSIFAEGRLVSFARVRGDPKSWPRPTEFYSN